MFIVYIIYSNKTDKYYIGTTDDFNKRLDEHNNAVYPNAYTRNGEPWVLKKCFCCELSKEAYFMERFIKRMKSRDFIEKIINDPSLFYEIMKGKM
jgi:putative endonuclease